MRSVANKKITVEQANRMLPLVRRIMEDILKAGGEMKEMSRETMTGDNATRLESRISDLKSYLHELEELGCTYKDWDFKTGLVEFPSELDGQPILLSWRSDESSVSQYYGVEEDHLKRRALPGMEPSVPVKPPRVRRKRIDGDA